MQLVNGGRVVIVGGGPAGSFFALHLLKLAEAARIKLDLVIYEARDFNQPGPGGCNKCAGILSTSFISKLESFGLRMPDELIQAELDTYVLHMDGIQLTLQPHNSSERLLSVFRGGGPRQGSPPHPLSFDAWLLEQAQELGAEVRRVRVQNVLPRTLPVVLAGYERMEADLVVIASGINTRTPLHPDWKYRPPQHQVMAQEEVLASRSLLGRSVHVFLNHPSDLIFGGVIPKGRYANISLLGKTVPRDLIAQFLNREEITPLLTDKPPQMCSCFPRVGISCASGFYADRMVVVGDAAIARLYKDGIGAAFTTAKAAATTAVFHGISRQHFQRSYLPVCKRIAADNRYGRWLFRLWDVSRRSPVLIEAWKQAILSETRLNPQKRVHAQVLWGAFTGEDTYRKIFSLLMSYQAFHTLLAGMVKAWRQQ